MSTTAGIYKRFIDQLWNQRQLQALDALVAPELVGLAAGADGPLAGRDGVRRSAALLHRAVPDLTVVIEATVCEGERLAARSSWRGSHRGELLGVAASGRPLAFGAIEVVRVVDGRVVERWSQLDWLALLQQIGAVGR